MLRHYWRTETILFLSFWLILMLVGRSRFFIDPGAHWHIVVGEHILAVVIAALLLLSLLIVFLRLNTYNEPMIHDLASYTLIAHEMLTGQSLYPTPLCEKRRAT